MTFALTVLETYYDNQFANKVISPDPERCKPYDEATVWRATPREYTGLEKLAYALEWLADRPRMMIVRGGRTAQPAFRGSVLRRYADPKPANNYFEPVPRARIVFDFDGTPVGAGLGHGDQVETCGLYLRSQLPTEFRNVRAVASVTGSTGLAKNLAGENGRNTDSARLRLFFLLEERVSDVDLTLWMKGVNWVWKLDLDPSILGTVQPVYTARPMFIDGLVDPVPCDRRVKILPGASDYVDLDLDRYASIADRQLNKERSAQQAPGQ
jgi:hypothetical protein